MRGTQSSAPQRKETSRCILEIGPDVENDVCLQVPSARDSRRLTRERCPEPRLSRMLAPEPGDKFGMAFVPAIVGDVGLLTLDLSYMAHGMAVARGACLLQRVID